MFLTSWTVLQTQITKFDPFLQSYLSFVLTRFLRYVSGLSIKMEKLRMETLNRIRSDEPYWTL